MHNILILPDLHGAPGGQSDNLNTGCQPTPASNQTGESNNANQPEGGHFDTKNNKDLAVKAMVELGKICQAHGRRVALESTAGEMVIVA